MASRNRNVHFSGGEWITTPVALPPVKELSQSQYRRDVSEENKNRCLELSTSYPSPLASDVSAVMNQLSWLQCGYYWT
jgi:hypothetical protein